MPGPEPQTGTPAQPPLKDLLPKLEPRRRRAKPGNPTPRPETPSLPPPPDTDSLTFQTPSRRILSKEDHDLFDSSPTHKLIQAWIFTLAESVTDTPCSAVKEADFSAPVRTILEILDEAAILVEQAPPNEQGGSRFGNKVFRDFLDLAKAKLPEWHRRLGLTSDGAIDECSTYLLHSLGNHARIDYGSGHELNFAMWLLCLYQLGVVSRADFRPLVLRVFDSYLVLMRTVQSTYYLEPAGSHGVWGLDDYQFLPFMFGSSQLLHHPYITPLSVHQELTLEEFGSDYLYLGQVMFVNNTKTVKGLRWHSPMLDDISASKSWTKVEGGMRRMFVNEVLGKLPVMQHFLFGSLIPAVEGMSTEEAIAAEEEGDHGHAHPHTHDHKGWNDACGISVPSYTAARAEEAKRGTQQLRRIPFD
ncbi:serine/threonine-protein phosphatase 2A activator [Candidatus Bathyarchaeota archaeon]|nr:serine/threonine-protein phosphatase 2A activator [Candidatus Bathyarchaeota archaeon]